jgi:ribonuclease T2
MYLVCSIQVIFFIKNKDTVCLGSPSCQKIVSELKDKNSLTLHGLWPSYIDGRIMDKSCNPGPEVRIIGEQSDLFDEMRQVWRSFIHSDEDFWTHEYNKHGYCYITKYQKTDFRAFFKLTIDMFNKFNFEGLVKRALGETAGERSLQVSEFIEAIGQETNGFTFTLSCKTYAGKQYVQEIRFNFGMNLDPIKTEKASYSGNCSRDKPLYMYFN